MLRKKAKKGKIGKSVYEEKKSLNFLGKQLRKDPYNNQLKQKYFYQLRCFRKFFQDFEVFHQFDF
jgi:hypothetical protein